MVRERSSLAMLKDLMEILPLRSLLFFSVCQYKCFMLSHVELDWELIGLKILCRGKKGKRNGGVIFSGSLSWFSLYNHTNSCAVIMEKIVVQHHIWTGRSLSRWIARNAKPGIAPKVIHIRLCPHFCHCGKDTYVFFPDNCDKMNSENVP